MRSFFLFVCCSWSLATNVPLSEFVSKIRPHPLVYAVGREPSKRSCSPSVHKARPGKSVWIGGTGYGLKRQHNPGFFAVFCGIPRDLGRGHWFSNPNGIEAFSPGLARLREGLPWVAAITSHNPERVEYQMLTKRIQPFQGFDFLLSSPRVARSSQPWAERYNPFGIDAGVLETR
jgi:hypothetical protein